MQDFHFCSPYPNVIFMKQLMIMETTMENINDHIITVNICHPDHAIKSAFSGSDFFFA